jgi:hypothetical protein
VLLKGQSLTVVRPTRATGVAIGAAATGVALILAIALLAQAVGWPVSVTLFLGIIGIIALLAVAAIFGFWTYACYSLRYVIDRRGVAVVWGATTHFLSFDRIKDFQHGRAEHVMAVGGIAWPGYHVGAGTVDEFGDVLFFSTHRDPGDLVYIRTEGATYGISPSDPVRFIAEAQRFQAAARPEHMPEVQRMFVAANPIWVDRIAWGLGGAAILLNLLLWLFVSIVYPDLDSQITIEFPPLGDIVELHDKNELLKIPITATAILGINVLAALIFEARERAAAYLLLSGALFAQLTFWVAAVVALSNA